MSVGIDGKDLHQRHTGTGVPCLLAFSLLLAVLAMVGVMVFGGPH